MSRAVWLDVGDRDLREYLVYFFRVVGWTIAGSPRDGALIVRGGAGRLVFIRGADWRALYGPFTPERLARACTALLRARRAS